MDNQLPAEVQEEIKLKAEDIANHLINGRVHPETWESVFKSHENCAIEYATKLQTAMQMLFRLTSLVNADQKPDEKFLTEIKTFLDGK